MKKGMILAVAVVGLLVSLALYGQEAATAAAPQKTLRLHTVKAGENLHLLAGFYYGDARQWEKIWELNKKEVRNPNWIRVGQVLKIEVAPGWQAKFDLDKYIAETAGKTPAMKKVVTKQPTVVREKEDVHPTVMPRLLEEAKPEEGSPSQQQQQPPPPSGEQPPQ